MTKQKVSLESENKPEKGYGDTTRERNGIGLRDDIFHRIARQPGESETLMGGGGVGGKTFQTQVAQARRPMNWSHGEEVRE